MELIDSIIELSNLENPDLKVEFEDLDLMDIINSTVNKLRTRIEAKNIDLILNLQPSPIKANTRMINDLVFNLLDNSIKYNVQGGKIFISLRENEESISFFIGDTGIGISEKDLVRIFERFYIVDKSRNKNLNSTGLGLSIVKHIVEIHRAKINISSRPSLGTEIEIIFKKP